MQCIRQKMWKVALYKRVDVSYPFSRDISTSPRGILLFAVNQNHSSVRWVHFDPDRNTFSWYFVRLLSTFSQRFSLGKERLSGREETFSERVSSTLLRIPSDEWPYYRALISPVSEVTFTCTQGRDLRCEPWNLCANDAVWCWIIGALPSTAFERPRNMHGLQEIVESPVSIGPQVRLGSKDKDNAVNKIKAKMLMKL